jgi:hypothetical protein
VVHGAHRTEPSHRPQVYECLAGRASRYHMDSIGASDVDKWLVEHTYGVHGALMQKRRR